MVKWLKIRWNHTKKRFNIKSPAGKGRKGLMGRAVELETQLLQWEDWEQRGPRDIGQWLRSLFLGAGSHHEDATLTAGYVNPGEVPPHDIFSEYDFIP